MTSSTVVYNVSPWRTPNSAMFLKSLKGLQHVFYREFSLCVLLKVIHASYNLEEFILIFSHIQNRYTISSTTELRINPRISSPVAYDKYASVFQQNIQSWKGQSDLFKTCYLARNSNVYVTFTFMLSMLLTQTKTWPFPPRRWLVLELSLNLL